MTAKEYLSQAYRLDQRINSDIREKEELQQLLYGISSPRLKEHVQTSKDPDAAYVRVIEKIAQLEDCITREIDQLVDLKIEIHEGISRMEDPEEQFVLQARYCEGLSWENVAVLMQMSVRNVLRIHASALDHFAVPEKKSKKK